MDSGMGGVFRVTILDFDPSSPLVTSTPYHLWPLSLTTTDGDNFLVKQGATKNDIKPQSTPYVLRGLCSKLT